MADHNKAITPKCSVATDVPLPIINVIADVAARARACPRRSDIRFDPAASIDRNRPTTAKGSYDVSTVTNCPTV
jgi:hypothetical protein